ncbi:DUF4238 domain-containing protein [Pseudomonas viridiflava]|uniref:DUF4238 domain-containing protein n=1 Tax=Pseudomonas viridiflava TaxID=33069 RepID=UPI000F01D772|nr:DUF4238 domain-containing protein [Pseudomonas viridiflava]MDY0938321.1 DUF4238 domain-containing protein [Pseudomonas viridiflava]MDY1015402.1 DUF4238 domain-containing protein [Pseudomonas viridiflava]
MSEPKLHHYVPRFYLKNFLNNRSRLYVFDKTTAKIFPTTENSVAAENQFYRLPKPVPEGVDPLVIEKNFAAMESSAATIINKLLSDIDVTELGGRLEISNQDRIILSEFISAQYYRTLEFYDLLPFLLSESKSELDVQALSEQERKLLHFYFLANSGCIENFTSDLLSSIWMFAKNPSNVQLMTSDHPVSIKNFENTMWLKGIAGLSDGEYVVYPLSPKVVMYCKERQRWSSLEQFDQTVSLIELNEEMVHHENAGQCFMATRFLISQSDDFEEVKDFMPSIGTELYSSGATPTQDKALQRTLKYNASRKQGIKRKK